MDLKNQNNEQKQEKQPDSGFEDFNIFNEIKDTSKVEKEIEKAKDKNIYDYLSFYGGIIKITDIVLFLLLLVSFFYIFIQNSDSYYENSYLNLFCPIFLGSEANEYVLGKNCSSATSLDVNITEEIKKTKLNSFDKITSVLPDIFSFSNSNSKEKEFLLKKTKGRLRVLDIIEEFEKLKDNYDIVDKKKIICKNLSINADKVAQLECEAFSTERDSISSGFGNKKIKGKSISLAISFIDYMEKNANKFSLVNRQKDFSEDEVNEGYYLYKTSFVLQMKYKTELYNIK